jgi:hypothetical protein
MAVIQTAADPPNQGRIFLAKRGWIWKRRKALENMVTAVERHIAPEYSTGSSKSPRKKRLRF